VRHEVRVVVAAAPVATSSAAILAAGGRAHRQGQHRGRQRALALLRVRVRVRVRMRGGGQGASGRGVSQRLPRRQLQVERVQRRPVRVSVRAAPRAALETIQITGAGWV
jgi:hypothetical protein